MMRNDAVAAPAAAFAHVQAWIFDLDNTLYPAACNLFAQVDVRITDFIARELGLDAVAAKRLQKDYYRRFGTSLRGMMLDHGTDPERFLHYVHDIDVTALAPSPALADAIGALPGRKLIYTNGSVRHAENVMNRLGIAQHFSGIFDIVAADYRPKPDPQPYAEMVARFGVDSRRAAFVEDLHRNLVPPAAMGMTTVWLRADSAFSHPENKVGETAAPTDHPGDHVHHIIDDLEAWLVALAAELSPAP